jgi:hypothetical protein
VRGPDEDVMAELHQAVIGVLQKCYPLLSNDELAILCIATGVSPKDAFPWHNEQQRRAA